MSATLDVATATVTQPTDADITHEVCCVDDDLAMCGLRVADADWTDVDPVSCVVCADLYGQWTANASEFSEELAKPGVHRCRLCPKNIGGAP